jgi:hypothetical protein
LRRLNFLKVMEVTRVLRTETENTGAAVVGATMVRAAAAGATEVDGTSGVMYGAVVVGGMDGVLVVCCMVQQ